MNVGYMESIKDLNFQCFVFHDVDLILENDNALYNCPEQPLHLSSAIDKFNYTLLYPSYFGKHCNKVICGFSYLHHRVREHQK